MSQGLTPEGERIVGEIASRHGFSSGAAVGVLHALSIGNATQAQFNHPELGGMGQWSQGGMIMIGDMFNQGLKARVDALCRDVADLLRGQDVFAAAAPKDEGGSGQSQGYSVSGASMSIFAQGFESPQRNWWPSDLGKPSSMGSQNDMHYAYFPSSNRLAIKQGDAIRIYDSGDHRISGVSQQQSGDQSLKFTSQLGVVRISDLKVVPAPPGGESEKALETSPAPTGQEADGPPARAARQSPASAAPPSAGAAVGGAADIFSTLERLAELRQKNILNDDEFAAKKAELLARL